MTPIVILFFLAAASLWAYPKWQAFVERRRFAVDLANVALIQGPRLFASEWEGDVEGPISRAETLIGLLQHAQNSWITPADIIVRVYRPHSHGKARLPFDTWRSMVQDEFSSLCAIHAAKHGRNPLYETNTKTQSAN